MRCKVTFRTYFSDFGLRGNLAHHRAILTGYRALERLQPGRLRPDRCHQWLDADDVHDARQIVGEHVQCHLAGNLRQRLHQKVRRAHPHLQCTEGCSNVSRRRRMASGFLSSLFCTASTTSSCSHRVMRRCGPFVHLALSWQARQFVQ